MIEINLIGRGKPSRVRRAAAPLAAVAVLAAASGLYVKGFGFAGGAEPAETRAGKAEVRKRVSSSAPDSETAAGRKVRESAEKTASFKVAGFVSLMDKNFAMLVSSRGPVWVEEGESAFGLRMASIREEGVLAEGGSGAGGTVFVPMKK